MGETPLANRFGRRLMSWVPPGISSRARRNSAWERGTRGVSFGCLAVMSFKLFHALPGKDQCLRSRSRYGKQQTRESPHDEGNAGRDKRRPHRRNGVIEQRL